MKKLALIVMILAGAYADMEHRIAGAIQSVAKRSGADPMLYYAIMRIESDFYPWIIALTTDKWHTVQIENMADANIKVKRKPFKRGYLVTFKAPDQISIVRLAKKLYKARIRFDAGLMQVSSTNFSEAEIEKIFTPEYNVAKASNILADCTYRYQDIVNAIECYNKGYGKKRSYEYFARFARIYLKERR